MISKNRVLEFLKLMLLFVLMHLVSACPSPHKIKEIIKLSKHQKRSEQYESVFKNCFGTKNSDVMYGGITEDKEPVVYLDLNPDSKSTDWQISLICFQRSLSRKRLNYQVIEVADGRGPNFPYTKTCLEHYDKAFALFTRNVEQIGNNEIDDLWNTMNYTRATEKAIKELFAYIRIENLKDGELIFYPSDEVLGDDRIVFKLKISENATLYFSYKIKEEQAWLTAVDLNNSPSQSNFSNLFLQD